MNARILAFAVGLAFGIFLMLTTGCASRTVHSMEPDFQKRLINHEKHYDVVLRKAFGCEPAPAEVNQKNCTASYAVLDYTELKKARKAAAELYGFDEGMSPVNVERWGKWDEKKQEPAK